MEFYIGLNEAFIIDRIMKDIRCKGSKNAEIIKPLVVGDDVSKYEINYRKGIIYLAKRHRYRKIT